MIEASVSCHMGELLVRRPWRGRGIGLALMLEECAELRRRGVRRLLRRRRGAIQSGALRLHESLGFRSSRGATLLYEKQIGRG